MAKSDIMEVSDTPFYNTDQIQNLDYKLIEEEDYKYIIARRWTRIKKIPGTKNLDYSFVVGKVTREDLEQNGEYRLLLFNINLDNRYYINSIDKYVCKPVLYKNGNTRDNIRLVKEEMEYTGNHPVLQMVLNKAKRHVEELKLRGVVNGY